MRSNPHRLWITAVFAMSVGLPPNASAQQGRPALPDTTVVVPAHGPRFPGVPVSAASAYRGSPPESYRVLLSSALAGAALDSLSTISTMWAACKRVDQPLAPPQGGTDTASPRNDGRYFVVVVLPISLTVDECSYIWNHQPLAIWRGVSYLDVPRTPLPTPRAVRLIVDDSIVAPAIASVQDADEWDGRSWGRSRSQLRYYYPMELLGARSDGTPRRMRVEVFSDTAMTTLHIPDSVMARNVVDYAIWRLATISTDSGQTVATIEPRLPVGPMLRNAVSRSARTSLRGGALLSYAIFAAPAATSADKDIDIATLLIAQGALTSGDVTSAKALVRMTAARRECVVAPSGVSVELRAIVAASQVPCRSLNATKVFGAGLLIPGGGHFASKRPVLGLAASGAIATVLGFAMNTNANAHQRYATYSASQDFFMSPGLYREATDLRQQARVLAFAGAALWAADAVMAAFQARARNGVIAAGRL